MNESKTEICDECAKQGKKIYRCGKCGASLCIHSVRTHKCERSVYKGKPEKSHDHSISKAYWRQYLEKKETFEIQINKDLSFYIEFPFMPFTLLSAWVPLRRGSYKTETKRQGLDFQELFDQLEEESETEYHRKFFYDSSKRSWAEDEMHVWLVQWKRSSVEYWENPQYQRKTKFYLQFPQLANDDIRLLKKYGVKVTYEPGAKENLEKEINNALDEFVVRVDATQGNFTIEWSKSFNRWFHTFFEVFIRYMAIKREEDSDEYIPFFIQETPRKITIDYWAIFRANYFWHKIQNYLKKQKVPLFRLKYKSFELKTAKWPSDRKPTRNYKLRPYQQEAIDLWISDGMFGTVQLPTGAGKTLIGIDAIKETNQRTLILVPNLALVEQWTQQLHEMLGVSSSAIGIFNGQKKEFRNHPVVISTYQLLSQYINDFLAIQDDRIEQAKRKATIVEDTIGIYNNQFGLIITDEAHHIQADTFRLIAMNLQIPRRLSLSATIEESQHSSLVIGIMGPIVFSIGYGPLSRDGYIAPLHFERIYVPLTNSEKKRLKEKKYATRVKGKLTRNSTNKFRALLEIVKSDLTEQILIYTTRVSNAKKINKFLSQNKIDSKVITGETVSNHELEDLLERFRQKEIHILILVKMLNEGFDAPADTVVIFSGTRNKREQIQRIGRATRPGKVATIFELVISTKDMQYEEEIAEARDISNIINPLIQETLISRKKHHKIRSLVATIENSFEK